MGYEELIQMIGSVGFPIVMCFVMFFFVKETTKTHAEEVERLNKEHKEEMEAITKAVENNTLVLEKTNNTMETVLKIIAAQEKKE